MLRSEKAIVAIVVGIAWIITTAVIIFIMQLPYTPCR
jgi:hypothetical protein